MTDLSQAAIDAAMAAVDELPQPVNPFEADRWRIVAEAAIAVATPYIRAGAVAAERERIRHERPFTHDCPYCGRELYHDCRPSSSTTEGDSHA